VRVVEIHGPLWVRVAAACLVVLGLVGMHHLVALGCATVSVGHADSHVPSVIPASGPDGPSPQQQNADLDFNSGTVVCLAIMVFAVSILGRRLAWIRRDPRRHVAMGHRFLGPQRTEPPDLVVLSISRT
jgi:hypothetical protein